MSIAAPQHMPAGSRRFCVTVLCFVVANVGAWIAYDRVARPRLPILEVRQFLPADASVVRGRPTLSWSFNLDVAPTSPDAPPGEVTPAVGGRWQWADPRTLTFTPDEPLPRATRFQFALRPDRLRTPEGFGLRKTVINTVSTPRLDVVAVRQAQFDERDRLVIELEFNDEVVPAEVLHHLSVVTGVDKPLHCELHGAADGHVVRVITDSYPSDPARAFVRVGLSPGLTGRGGPLGMEGAYQCNLPIGSDLVATEAGSYFADGSSPVLTLRFNNRVDLGVLKPLVSVTPAVPFTMSEGYRGVELRGAFAPSIRYAIHIGKAAAGVPRSTAPRANTLSVFVPDVPSSFWFQHREGYLGSSGNRTLLAHAVNTADLRVSVSRVYDNNLVAWRNHPAGYWHTTDTYGRPIASKVFHLPRRKNVTQDVRVSLDEILPAGAPRDGAYVFSLEPARAATSNSGDDGEADDDDGPHRYGRRGESAVVTLSDIGLTAKRGRAGVTVWATSLRTAAPQANVRVRVYSNKNQFLGGGTTGADGLATVFPTTSAAGEDPSVVLADRVDGVGDSTSARDLTWLDLRGGRLDFAPADTAGAAYLHAGFEAFVYSERGVYRPGETVHLRAIVRGPDGAVPPAFPVSWRFRRPDLHDWQTLAGQIDPDGAVSLDLPLPSDLPTGRWGVTLGIPGQTADAKAFGSATFQVEEFVPSRMQVGLKLEGPRGGNSPRFALDAEPLRASVQADYLFGKPVADRPTRVVARLDPATFAPAAWAGWTFGDVAETASALGGAKVTGRRIDVGEQTLDANGAALFEIEPDALTAADTGSTDDEAATPKRQRRVPAKAGNTGGASGYRGPWRLTVTASVIETGGRAVSTSQKADVDLVPYYVGVRNRGANVAPDVPMPIDVCVVSTRGEPLTRDMELGATLYREDWNNSLSFEGGRYVYHSTRLLEPVQRDLKVRVAGGKGSIEVRPPTSGAYVLRVNDPATGGVTSIAFYAGDGAWQDNVSRENPERLELVVRKASPAPAIWQALKARNVSGAVGAIRAAMAPSSDRFRAGTTAQVIVRSPFAGQLLLGIETDDVLSTRVIEMPASNVPVAIEIPSGCRANAYVTATVVRAVDPNAAWATHRAFGTVRLPIDNDGRRLRVAVEAPPEMRPGTTLNSRVRVTDALGAAVSDAAVSVAAVDEGVCQLTGFKTPDPFAFFTRDRALGVETADLFGQLMPEVPKPDKTSDVGGDKGGYDPRHASPVSARRVKTVALVSRVAHTDSEGFASVDFQVPQFTGKLRLMAVASAGPSSGSGEAATLVRSPLLVQSSWPRFAAPGDRFQVPLVVFNNSPASGAASVSVHVVDGPLRFGAARDVELNGIGLKGNGQSTRTIGVNVAAQSGVSRVQLTAKLGDETYVEDVEIPVRPASPEVTVGGYAVATPDKAVAVSLPGGMLEGTGRAQIRVTPLPSLRLPEGLDSLDRYPYGCLEQTTSTLFPLVYLPDVGSQIAPGLFEKEHVATKVAAGVTRLIGMQTAGGGLAMWPAYREPWPWGSVYAAHFLIEARKAGFEVPEEFNRQLLAYVRGLLNKGGDDPELLQAQAYACYVLALNGTPERAVMSRLGEVLNAPRPDKVEVPGEARFHLASAWLAAGRRDLAEGLIPQALPAPREGRSLAGSLASPVRDRAVLINTLLSVQPDHPGLPALVQALADAGGRHEWRSTQDTAFAVLALGRYLRQARASAPYKSAELLLDGNRLVSAQDAAPLTWDGVGIGGALPGSRSTFSVHVTGAQGTKAYVSWLEVGVPVTPPKAVDSGMTVRRRLLDEQGKPLAGGRVRSGDLVRVELSINAATPLQNLVLDDLLPAGLEIENPRLKTSVTSEAGDAAGRAEDPFHDTRLEMRDDRLVLMGDLLRAGTGTYVYTARAVTAGTYVLPPVRGECMYDSGTQSISDAGTLEVVPFNSSRLADISSQN